MSGGVDWVAADWGTSNLRVWLMDAADRPLRRLESDRGMGALSREEFAPTLAALLAPHLDGRRLPVVICGMAGSRQGWAEAPYAAAPCRPPTLSQGTRVSAGDAPLDAVILPGVRQADPPDVMRGEETQVAGVLAAEPGFDGAILLPGTHSKWVRVSVGEIVAFRTFMTGELFALLSERSVLRHSVAAEGWDEAAFLSGVEAGMARPEAVAADLFGLRAAALIADLGPQAARARLSGLLIGAELRAARGWRLGLDLRIVGAEGVGRAYAAALAAEGAAPRLLPAEETTLAGLAAARRESPR
jgi:2-dehydro-3-deoxygalactonokinase